MMTIGSTFSQHCTVGCSRRKGRKQIKAMQNNREESKMTFVENTIVSVENPKESTKSLLET